MLVSSFARTIPVSSFRSHRIEMLSVGTPLYDVRNMCIFCIGVALKALILDTEITTYWQLDEFEMIESVCLRENIDVIISQGRIVSTLRTETIPTLCSSFPVWLVDRDGWDVSLVPCEGEKISCSFAKRTLPRRCTYENIKQRLTM